MYIDMEAVITLGKFLGALGTIGGGVLGVVGMLLGVPLAAVAYQLFQEGME